MIRIISDEPLGPHPDDPREFIKGGRGRITVPNGAGPVTRHVSRIQLHYLERYELAELLEYARRRDGVPEGIKYVCYDESGWDYTDTVKTYVAEWWEVEIDG